MKIKPIDRFLLIVMSLFLICLAFGIIALAWNLYPIENVLYTLSLINAKFINSMIFTVISLIILVIGLKLLFMRGSKKAPKPKSTVIKSGESGVASISLVALESMIQREVKAHERVKDSKTFINVLPDGVSIHNVVYSLPGTNLVEMVESLQKNVKENIEALTGLNIKDVSITIEQAEPAPIV